MGSRSGWVDLNVTGARSRWRSTIGLFDLKWQFGNPLDARIWRGLYLWTSIN